MTGPTGYATPPMCMSQPTSRALEDYTRWLDEHPDLTSGTCPHCGKTMERDYTRHMEFEAALIAGGWGGR